MSNVTLSIGGRSYTVACAAGEEAHVASRGRMVDEKLAAMGGAGGQNEVRQLLFASLLLADEVHEARKATATGLQPDRTADADSEIAPLLERFAERVEIIAERLEGLPGNA